MAKNNKSYAVEPIHRANRVPVQNLSKPSQPKSAVLAVPGGGGGVQRYRRRARRLQGQTRLPYNL